MANWATSTDREGEMAKSKDEVWNDADKAYKEQNVTGLAPHSGKYKVSPGGKPSSGYVSDTFLKKREADIARWKANHGTSNADTAKDLNSLNTALGNRTDTIKKKGDELFDNSKTKENTPLQKPGTGPKTTPLNAPTKMKRKVHFGMRPLDE